MLSDTETTWSHELKISEHEEKNVGILKKFWIVQDSIKA
jgi:hypothetical protein